MGPHDKRIVPAVMPHQYRHSSACRKRDQFACFIQMHPHRFFQEDRHAGSQAVERGADMQRVRVGDDDRLRLGLFEHLPVIGKKGHAALSGKLSCLRAGIGHGTQLRFAEGTQVLIVLASHDTGTDQGNPKGCVQGGGPLAVVVSCLFRTQFYFCASGKFWAKKRQPLWLPWVFATDYRASSRASPLLQACGDLCRSGLARDEALSATKKLGCQTRPRQLLYRSQQQRRQLMHPLL
ncbi:hypothetical protein D9M71_178120 [compost metagenome]